jgi:hypothetical protein
MLAQPTGRRICVKATIVVDSQGVLAALHLGPLAQPSDPNGPIAGIVAGSDQTLHEIDLQEADLQALTEIQEPEQIVVELQRLVPSHVTLPFRK